MKKLLLPILLIPALVACSATTRPLYTERELTMVAEACVALSGVSGTPYQVPELGVTLIFSDTDDKIAECEWTTPDVVKLIEVL